jgi:hypothetical protein
MLASENQKAVERSADESRAYRLVRTAAGLVRALARLHRQRMGEDRGDEERIRLKFQVAVKGENSAIRSIGYNVTARGFAWAQVA